jgi:hypothetical protein
MSRSNRLCLKCSMVVFALTVVAVFGIRAFAQENRSDFSKSGAFVEDWSTRHLIFSNPGSEEDAIRRGEHDKWLRIVNDHRYIMQERRRHSPAQWGGWHERPGLDRDWSMLMGSGTSTVRPNTYPAKFELSTTATPSCADYIVYPTGYAGSSTQATIIGYTNLYKTTCGSTVPTIAFAYNTGTGDTVGLSPVISEDGTQIAFIQVSGTAASLVLLKPLLTSGGTVSTPTLAGSAGAYTTCSAPCYYEMALSGTTTPNDTYSAPFYTYISSVVDTIFVGDNAGKVHKFNPVFFGTTGTPPAEITSGTPAWPAAVSTVALNSPVYDGGTSANVYVTDTGGYLYSFSSAASPGTVAQSSRMECGAKGFVDGPLVDSTTEEVYVFVGDGCSDENMDDTGYSSYVNRFVAGTVSDYGAVSAEFGNENTNDTDTVQYLGTFDNTYYSGSGTTGNLYTCVNGAVFQIPMSSLSGDTQVLLDNDAFSTEASTVSDTATCSPLTEFHTGATPGVDHLFVSLQANGDGTGCSTGCIYYYNITTAGTTGSPADSLAVTGGTAGIVIDNNGTATGESQVYFLSNSSETCGGNGSTGSGTGTCAVQASQSALQ